MGEKLRIDISLGRGGTSDDGTDLFKPEYEKRIEIECVNFFTTIAEHREELLRLVKLKITEIMKEKLHKEEISVGE